MKAYIWKRFGKPPLASLTSNYISAFSVGVPDPYHGFDRSVMVASLENLCAQPLPLYHRF